MLLSLIPQLSRRGRYSGGGLDEPCKQRAQRIAGFDCLTSQRIELYGLIPLFEHGQSLDYCVRLSP